MFYVVHEITYRLTKYIFIYIIRVYLYIHTYNRVIGISCWYHLNSCAGILYIFNVINQLMSFCNIHNRLIIEFVSNYLFFYRIY